MSASLELRRVGGTKMWVGRNNLSFFYPHECITSELMSDWGHLRISWTCNKYFSFHSCRLAQERDGKWSAPTIQSTSWDVPHYHQIHTLIAKAAMQEVSIWDKGRLTLEDLHASMLGPHWTGHTFDLSLHSCDVVDKNDFWSCSVVCCRAFLSWMLHEQFIMFPVRMLLIPPL